MRGQRRAVGWPARPLGAPRESFDRLLMSGHRHESCTLAGGAANRAGHKRAVALAFCMKLPPTSPPPLGSAAQCVTALLQLKPSIIGHLICPAALVPGRLWRQRSGPLAREALLVLVAASSSGTPASDSRPPTWATLTTTTTTTTTSS